MFCCKHLSPFLCRSALAALFCLTSSLQAAILVIGGGGYVGSHTVLALLNANEDVIIFDTSTSIKEKNLAEIKQITRKIHFVVHGDIQHPSDIDSVFAQYDIEGVVYIADSKPPFSQNVFTHLLSVMKKYEVFSFVFSASSAVCAEEDALCDPEEAPSGEVRFMAMKALREASQNDSSLGIVILRYLHPMGAHVERFQRTRVVDGVPGIETKEHCFIGDWESYYVTTPEERKNLFPMLCEVAGKLKDHMSIYKDKTFEGDGTLIRDYIHVEDVARAHALSIDWLKGKNGFQVWSLGRGFGATTLETVNAFSRHLGVEIPYKFVKGQATVIPEILANPQAIKSALGWMPLKGVNDIAKSSWLFHQAYMNNLSKHHN